MMLGSVKFGLACVVILGCVWGGLEVYETWRTNPGKLKDPAPAAPLRQVLFATDGVLGQAWIGQALALPKGASLMTLDLGALEARLLASGQVRSVVLRRRFADNTLLVNVRERTPVARMMVQAGRAGTTLLLAAADGVVYEGSGYDRATLERLPWLDGIAMRRAARGAFEPVAGMGAVAGLLTAAEGLVPQARAGWEVVSLARLASDQEIIVRSRDIPEIIFSAADSYPRQLAKLDYILDTLRTHGAPPVARVNLALGSQVPVALQETARLAPARAAPPMPSPQPRQRRDF